MPSGILLYESRPCMTSQRGSVAKWPHFTVSEPLPCGRWLPAKRIYRNATVTTLERQQNKKTFFGRVVLFLEQACVRLMWSGCKMGHRVGDPLYWPPPLLNREWAVPQSDWPFPSQTNNALCPMKKNKKKKSKVRRCPHPPLSKKTTQQNLSPFHSTNGATGHEGKATQRGGRDTSALSETSRGRFPCQRLYGREKKKSAS